MKSVCFTGHRRVDNIGSVMNGLKMVIEELALNGFVDFYTGGAIGFDTLAATAVIELCEKYHQIKLHLILPCFKTEQTDKWTIIEIAEYDRIAAVADSIEYVSEHYYNGCMKARNERLIELADCCVCYYNCKKSISGTGQTVRMAEQKGIRIINTRCFD